MPRRAYATSTRTADDRLVPWLAAQGPLSYTPESPPLRDGLFQYGWVLPQVCRPDIRQHLYFGATRREHVHELFAFWASARSGALQRITVELGGLLNGNIEAPIAVYRHDTRLGEKLYLLIQHGSYQCIPVEEQPELEAGYVHLHRGIGEAKRFHFWEPFRTGSDPHRLSAWERYAQLQFDVLSLSDLSFNSIHDRAKRAETCHINDGTWLTDKLAHQRGLDIEHDAWSRALWSATHQSFALRSCVAEHKFGPSRVVLRTPLTNIRMTSFFAHEHEARLVDPDRVEVVTAIGCKVSTER